MSVYTDGTYTSIVSSGAARIFYPLQDTGDVLTVGVEQDYTVLAPNVPPPTGMGTNTHPLNANVYMMAQGSPSMQFGVAQITRTFCSVPARSNVGTSVAVVLPDVPVVAPNAWGNYFVYQPDPSIELYDIYGITDITSDSGPPNYTVTGGNYTLTVDGDTTSVLAYNANLTTVNAAINALASVTAANGAVVTGSYSAGFSHAANALPAPVIDTALIVYSGTLGSYYVGGTKNYSPTLAIYPLTGAITGGNYLVTLMGDTANLDYNANIVTINTAINALPNVAASGGAVISGTAWNGARIDWQSTFNEPVITGDAANLTPATASISAQDAGVAIVDIDLIAGVTDRTLTATDHGITQGDSFLLYDGSTPRILVNANYSVVSANIVALTPNYALSVSGVATFTNIGTITVPNYSPGPVTTVATRQTDYYLPGVTANVTTYLDIPVIEEQSTDTELLTAIFAGSGNLAYRVDSLGRWNGWPIYQQSQTVIDIANLQ